MELCTAQYSVSIVLGHCVACKLQRLKLCFESEADLRNRFARYCSSASVPPYKNRELQEISHQQNPLGTSPPPINFSSIRRAAADDACAMNQLTKSSSLALDDYGSHGPVDFVDLENESSHGHTAFELEPMHLRDFCEAEGGVALNPMALDAALALIDADQNGKVSEAEFLTWWLVDL